MRDTCRLGVPQNDYNVNRNIVGSMPSWSRRTRPLDRRRITSAILDRCGCRVTPRLRFTFTRPYAVDCDLFHFFNTVADVRRPWITTFETSLPRWGDAPPSLKARGLRLLGSDSCRRLIAMSEAARHIATSEWRDALSAADATLISEKLEVLHPPQAVILEPASTWTDDTALFAFVGGDFYRKGGLETLEAFHRLEAAGVRNWRLVMVGHLDRLGDYASRADDSSRLRARELLAALSHRIEHHSRLPYPLVLDLLKASHYCLLPTLADTYGYSVLEAQACAAVAITTNVRALPEIVSSKTGYVIELPLDERRDAHTLPDFARSRREMIDSLEAILRDCCRSTPARWMELASSATSQLRRQHDPAEHARRLETVYRQALDADRKGGSR